MNRIVRERYPVSRLPEDLRAAFPGQEEVTIIVQPLDQAIEAHPSDDDQDALAAIAKDEIRGGDFSRFKHLRRANFASAKDVDVHISALRDEWADRER